MPKVRVTRTSRPDRPEFTCGDMQAAIDYVIGKWVPGADQYAIWMSEQQPSKGPDCVVCVPFRVLEDCQARAAEVVAHWEESWLLIESMPARHRDAARDHLLGAIAHNLLVAAVSGIDHGPRDIDDDF